MSSDPLHVLRCLKALYVAADWAGQHPLEEEHAAADGAADGAGQHPPEEEHDAADGAADGAGQQPLGE